MSDDNGEESAVWVADMGLFVAGGRRGNGKYTALSRFARRRGITVRIPKQVHEELGGAPERSSPASLPIDEGWVTVADMGYTDATVSVLDDARRFIANASNRDEDTVERADTALAGVAVQLLDGGEAERIRLVTTDQDAGEATVAVLESHGYDGQVEWRNGFDLLDDLS